MTPLSHVQPSDDSGATAVEYGLLVALIAAVIAVAVGNFGGFVSGLFEAARDAFPQG